MKQSEIWLATEGDAWHRRNAEKSRYPDPVMEAIEANKIKPQRVLEIGCGTGWRLKDIHVKFSSECCGLEPSLDAISNAVLKSPEEGYIEQATADEMRSYIEDDSVDLLIFGFVLYQIDREDLFRIVYEADCILDDGGHIIIHDFFKEPETFEVVDYKHDPRLKTFKMNFASLWLAHPFYTLVDERFGPEQTVVSVLRKQVT